MKERKKKMISEEKRINFNRNQMKYIAVIAMLFDHIAWMAVPKHTLLGQILHFIGRLTGPVMAFFIAEGYQYTKNVKRYILRLGLFAVLSWWPFVYFFHGTFPIVFHEHSVEIFVEFGMIYTLFLGLLAICLYEKREYPQWIRWGGIFLFLLCSGRGDWGYFGVLACLLFHTGRWQPRKMWTTYMIGSCLFIALQMMANGGVVQNLYMTGILVVPLLAAFAYNGEPGSRRAVHKWFFYIFYPAHLVVLGVLKYVVLV